MVLKDQSVTAHDFVYSWQRLLNPETGAEYGQFLRHVKGAEAYRKKEAGATVEAIGVIAVIIFIACLKTSQKSREAKVI